MSYEGLLNLIAVSYHKIIIKRWVQRGWSPNFSLEVPKLKFGLLFAVYQGMKVLANDIGREKLDKLWLIIVKSRRI